MYSDEIEIGDKVIERTSWSDNSICTVTRFGGTNKVWGIWGTSTKEQWAFANQVKIVEKCKKPKENNPIDISKLKSQAQQDIEAMIKKHTNILNQAGCSIDLSVNFHDVTQLSSDKPSQLVEVKEQLKELQTKTKE